MTTPVIKALTRRIRQRYGSTANAAAAAEVSPSVWSNYENDEHASTIPVGRFLIVANVSEKASLASILLSDGDIPPGCAITDSAETTEAAAELQREVRQALDDGKVTRLEARQIIRKAMAVKDNARDVIASVRGAA